MAIGSFMREIEAHVGDVSFGRINRAGFPCITVHRSQDKNLNHMRRY